MSEHSTTASSPSPSGGAVRTNSSSSTSKVTLSKGASFPSPGLYQTLGRIQGLSALAFSTFAIVHVTPPILAAFGGIELADKALLLGRVYYQNKGVELIMVSTSFFTHVIVGFGRAMIRVIWSIRAQSKKTDSDTREEVYTDDQGRTVRRIVKTTKTTTTKQGDRKIVSTSSDGTVQELELDGTVSASSAKSSWWASIVGGRAAGLFPLHNVVGWTLLPFLVQHFGRFRLRPEEVLGDSSAVDYSLVTFYHRLNRTESLFLFGGLVSLFLYHAASGSAIAWNNLVGTKKQGWKVSSDMLVKRKPLRMALAATVTTVALVGFYRIAEFDGFIPMRKHFDLL